MITLDYITNKITVLPNAQQMNIASKYDNLSDGKTYLHTFSIIPKHNLTQAGGQVCWTKENDHIMLLSGNEHLI